MDVVVPLHHYKDHPICAVCVISLCSAWNMMGKWDWQMGSAHGKQTLRTFGHILRDRSLRHATISLCCSRIGPGKLDLWCVLRGL